MFSGYVLAGVETQRAGFAVRNTCAVRLTEQSLSRPLAGPGANGPPWSHALARPMANGHYARVKPRSRTNPNRDQIAGDPDVAIQSVERLRAQCDANGLWVVRVQS